jgi:hypothetical protein
MRPKKKTHERWNLGPSILLSKKSMSKKRQPINQYFQAAADEKGGIKSVKILQDTRPAG